MIKEVFVIKRGTDLYYSAADWHPHFSANQQDALTYLTHKEAELALREFARESEYGTKWFPDGFYQIEKWYVVEEDDSL